MFLFLPLPSQFHTYSYYLCIVSELICDKNWSVFNFVPSFLFYVDVDVDVAVVVDVVVVAVNFSFNVVRFEFCASVERRQCTLRSLQHCSVCARSKRGTSIWIRIRNAQKRRIYFFSLTTFNLKHCLKFNDEKQATNYMKWEEQKRCSLWNFFEKKNVRSTGTSSLLLLRCCCCCCFCFYSAVVYA